MHRPISEEYTVKGPTADSAAAAAAAALRTKSCLEHATAARAQSLNVHSHQMRCRAAPHGTAVQRTAFGTKEP